MTIREELEWTEHLCLSERAQFSDATRGRPRPEEAQENDVRTCYQRDSDRILHSKSFRRLMHKTQVFLQPEGDHYRTRMTHTLEVARIARTITRALRLNEDLSEAIAFGHDLGHTPFGHAGEVALTEVMGEPFRHNEQSLRVVDVLEKDGQGLNLFIKAIPFNFYALLTILMLVFISILKLDYGPMARHERNAVETGDLFSGKNPYGSLEEEESSPNGRVLDLVFPILVLIVCCITGMIYSGGFFDGVGFVEAFSNSDASVGLMLGSAVAFIITLVYFAIRRSMPFSAMMSSIPEGFKAMVPAILILTFAWSLKGMTDSLGAKYFVRDFVYQNASNFQSFLPAIVFIIGCLLAFATGTSWGTFGMLIPIVQNVFPMDNPLAVVCISACMAGAVCGDHCSPISDTTIMASAGAQCDHVNHVSTQLPYAITVAAVSFVSYLIAGFVPKAYISLPIALVLMLLTIFVLHRTLKGKAAA